MNTNKIINLEDVVVQKGELDSVDMDGEVVMMNIEKGRYYGFNSVGSRIWQLIKQPLSVREVIYTLTKEFDVDIKVCEEEVVKFLNMLYGEEIISLA